MKYSFWAYIPGLFVNVWRGPKIGRILYHFGHFYDRKHIALFKVKRMMAMVSLKSGEIGSCQHEIISKLKLVNQNVGGC